MMIQATKHMTNNLEELILLSGLTKREVAKAKGITPETLSRHIHGKIQLTMKDAEEYAQILGSTPYDVLFEAMPYPVIGKGHIHADLKTDRHMNLTGIGKAYYPRSRAVTDTGVVVWTCDADYDGPYRSFNNAWQMIRLPDVRDPIPEAAIQNMALCKLSETIELKQGRTNFICGTLYPEPKNKWTVYIDGHFPDDNVQRGLDIELAMPVIGLVLRPDLRGGKIIYD